jgi:hypothetical protein
MLEIDHRDTSILKEKLQIAAKDMIVQTAQL